MKTLLVAGLLVSILLSGAVQCKTIVVDPSGKDTLKTVTAALSSAKNGDTIAVAPGLYRERLSVNRSVTLEGEGVEIDGQGGTVIKVNAPGCNLSNLSLTGGGNEAAVILLFGDNTLYNCSIRESSVGVQSSGRNRILGCIINAGTYALRLKGDGLEVKGCNLTANLGAAILMEGVNSSTIQKNVFMESITGVEARESDGNLLKDNLALGGKTGLSFKVSGHNILRDNTLQNIEIAGIYLENSKSNLVEDNRLEGCGNGVMLKDSQDNDLWGNLIQDGTYGISFKGSPVNRLIENVLRDNLYNIRVEGSSLGDIRLMASPKATLSMEDFNQSIDRTNTVDGRPVTYMVGEKDSKVPEDTGFLGLIGCENITASGLMLNNSSAGILMVGSRDSVVENCSLLRDMLGLSILDCREIVVTNTIARDCQVGFWIARSEDIRIDYDGAINCSDTGFSLDGSTRVQVRGGRATENQVGLSISNSPLCTVSRFATSSNQEHGLRLIASPRCTIKEVDASGNQDGISLSGSGYCLLAHVNASYNQRRGLSLEQLQGGDLLSSLVVGNVEGVFVQGTKGFRINSVNVSQNQRYGLRMSLSRECNVTENTFYRNGMAGIGLTDCSSNYLYHNNLVENGFTPDQNAVDNGANTWDMGPMEGGNYWSDHSGSSPRKIPSSGVDRYPLSQPWKR